MKEICGDIKVYSQFWSMNLSILFSFYISIQSYLIYLFFFTNLPLIQIYIFAYSAIIIESLLLALIHTCAKVGKLNSQFERQNISFYLNIQKQNGVKGLHLSYLLKAELLQTPRLLSAYSFKVFANYKITNKTFYIVNIFFSIPKKHL